MSKKAYLIAGLMALIGLVGCNEVSPEQQAAEAAKAYYTRLLEGAPEGFLSGKVDYDSLPADYRRQLLKAHEQYMQDMQQHHEGLRAVTISPNVARRDTTLHLVYAFLLLSYNDSTQEEITVPMVEVNGEWKIK